MREGRGFAVSLLLLGGCGPVTTQADAEAWSPPATNEAAPSTPATTVAPAPVAPPRPTMLSVPLEGPFAELADGLGPRAREVPEECEWPSPPTGPRQTLTLEPDAAGPVLEVRAIRTFADMACAPIEYCHLAVRTSSGWWLSPFDENDWCSGVVGSGVSVATEEEDVMFDEEHPERFVVSGVRLETRTEVSAARPPGGKRSARPDMVERTSSDPYAYACEVTPDATPWCQNLPSPPLVP